MASTRNSWPAKAPRKGTKARATLIRCLTGLPSEELRALYPKTTAGSWINCMRNEKGIEIRSVKGIFLVIGFYRENGRYRQCPGSVALIEALLKSGKKRPWKRKTSPD